MSRRPVFIAAIAGVAGIGLSVLVGWMLGVSSLKTILPGAVEMKANTAVGLLLSAAALLALNISSRSSFRAGVMVAVLVAALGAITLAEYAFNWNAGIDEMLFQDTASALNAARGRMSPLSAAAFVGIGLAIAVLPYQRLRMFTIVGGLLVLSIGAASLLGYLWNAPALTNDSRVPAVNAAVAFILLGGATMLAAGVEQRSELRIFTAVESRVLIGFVATISVLFGIGWYAHWVQAQAVESARRALRTQEVHSAINSAYYAVSEAQSAQRTYLFTARKIHKRAFTQRLKTIETELTNLARLVNADPAQSRNYEELRRLIGVRTTVLNRHVELFERVNLEEVRTAIGSAGGLEVMEAIRERAAEMHAVEGSVLARHEFDLERTRQLMLVAILVLLGVATTTVVLLFTGIRRETTMRIKADESAQRAIAAKENFLATVSHEIRTPVNGLLGMLELLALTRLDEQQRDLLSAARDSGSGLVRIVDDVLDHAKLGAGKLEIRPEPTSIHALAHRVVRTYLAVASAKDLVLVESVDTTISPFLLADQHRIAQILGNLVSNAIKFTSEGSVELRVERVAGDAERETIRFAVHDTGIGIDLLAQERLFQPFEQAASDTSRAYGGTGLGLAISRRLAELMNGTLEMKSAPGQGTTMSLILTLTPCDPLSKPAVEPVPTLPGPALAQASEAIVLAVDDHPLNRKLLSNQLAALGIQAVTASSGLEALEVWRSRRVDLVITDCNMPGMDGYSLSRAIRAEERHAEGRVPIVAWTASVLEGSGERCREAGMDGSLAKPSSLAQLRQLLSSWLHFPPARPDLALDPVALAGIARNEEELAQVIAEFVAQMASDLSAFDLALAAGDLDECGQIAHRMMGAALLVGARELAVMSDAIGRAATQNAQKVAALRPALDIALAQLTRYADTNVQGGGRRADS